MGENEKKQMKEDMAVQEAVTFLVENAVEKISPYKQHVVREAYTRV